VCDHAKAWESVRQLHKTAIGIRSGMENIPLDGKLSINITLYKGRFSQNNHEKSMEMGH
jgi:hypothetical protein